MDHERPLGRPEEVSRHLSVEEKTLTNWRWEGKGPRWCKVGRFVRYRWSDVEKWLDEQSKATT